MEENSPPVSQPTLSPWSQGFALIKSIWMQLMYLSLVGMAIPLFTIDLMANRSSLKLSEKINGFANDTDLFTFLDTWASFFYEYVFLTLITFVIVLVSYFAMVEVCWTALGQEKKRPLLKIWLTNIKLLPRAILSFLLVLATALGLVFMAQITSAIFAQLLMAVLVAGISLTYAIPILIWRGFSPWQALKKSLTIDYVIKGQYRKWALFFQIMSFHVLAIIYVMFSGFIIDRIRHFDEAFHFDRLWAYTPQSWPESPLFLATGFLEQSAISLLLAAFVAITTNYFFMLTSSKESRIT